MSDDLRTGDRVRWRTHGVETTGTVEEEITEDTERAGRVVRATPDEPRHEVVSDKSGRNAVHKPEALEKD